MRPADYLRAIRDNWLLIAVFVACGGIGLGFLAAGKDPVYTSETRLLVTFTPQPDQPSPQASRMMQRLVKTYTSALASPRLVAPVIGTLSLDTTPQDLGDRVTASSPVNSHEIRVTVTDSSAPRAAAVAGALTAELEKVAARERPSADLPASAGISVLSAPSVPDEPDAVRWQLHALAGLLAGFGIGLAAAVLRGRSNDGARDGVPLRRWSSMFPP